ncbi:MAG TPA: hypothetical protein VFZ66_06775 [Herpetosiphonaceae bacterium]
MADGNNIPPQRSIFQEYLALVVSLFSFAVIATLGGITIWNSDNTSETATTVFNAVLPLLGTWVGTVLAFYFTRENFEAANRAVTQVVNQLTPQEKLMSIPVRDKMIGKADMHVEAITAANPANQIILIEMLSRLIQAQKGNRIPILDENGCPEYVVHRSFIERFITNKSLSGGAQPLNTLTLQDLLDDRDVGEKLKTSFALIRADGTLADAKDAMGKTPNCQDVFVTAGGTRHEPVVGWITNVIIEENLKV